MKLRSSLLVLAVSSLFAGNAFAGTAQDQFQVSITVQNLCTITVGDVAFGTHDMVLADTASATGTVDCQGTGAWTVGFSAGNSGDASAREMTNAGTDVVTYNLYRDAGYTEILGDGTGSTFTIAGSGDGTFTVHGETDADQSVENGTYTDTITATVTF